MRKLMFAAIGYCCAIIAAHYIIPEAWLLWFAVGCFILAFTGLLFRGNWRRIIFILLISASLGFAWNWGHSALFIKPVEALVGSTEAVDVKVIDYPTVRENYSTIPVRMDEPGLPRVKVLLSDYENPFSSLKPGDKLHIELEFRSAGERYSVEDDYYFSSGIFLRARPVGEFAVNVSSDINILSLPKKLAHSLKDLILRVFPEDVAPVMKALLTGDKEELYSDDELYVSMSKAGLSHIIAVSGMHVSFIISLIGLATGRRRITAFLGIPLVWFFAAMVGFGPSVTRSSLMISLMLVAPILRRENDPPTSISAALLVLLLINPQAIGSVSLQLSFAAMAGIMLVSPRIYRAVCGLCSDMHRLPGTIIRSLGAVISSSVGALIFTIPISALHFGSVPLYSVFTNVLCIWAMSFAFMLSYPMCIIAAIWEPLGNILAGIIAWLPRYTIIIVKFIAKLPYASLYTHDNMAALWLVFVYAVLLLPWFFKGERNYRPIIPICCCVITLPLVLYLSGRLNNIDNSFTALDVGQGQCIVAAGTDATVMIDCGGKGAENAGDIAAEHILSSGRNSVDMLILTHLHDDHANGVLRLMSHLDVKRLALPGECESTEIGDKILEKCYDREVELYYISENTNIRLNELSLDLFAPIGSSDPNEKGLIVLGDYGEFEFLLTGDAGTSTENQLLSFYDFEDVELLVAGHHGSKYSSGERLLDSLKPEYAVISVGANSYGHPTQEVLDRFYERNIPVYRTDINGNITIMVGNYNG